MDIAYSINGVPIRLTAERWFHIVENHDDMAGHYDSVLTTVENPDFVIRGTGGTLIAVRSAGRQNYLYVVYRELDASDGFVISAFFSSRVERKKAIWRRER